MKTVISAIDGHERGLFNRARQLDRGSVPLQPLHSYHSTRTAARGLEDLWPSCGDAGRERVSTFLMGEMLLPEERLMF